MSQFTPTPHNPPTEQPSAETLLRRVAEIINNAKSMPLSASVLISKDEVLEMLEDAIARLPEELRQARWMLKERQEYLAKVEREGEEILSAARTRAERMVQRTEIVREAKYTAQKTVDDAREEARRLRLEAEDYCDQKLASFEIVLERTWKMVQAGREKLQGVPLGPSDGFGPGGPPSLGEDPTDEGAEAFFDQDVE